MVDTAIGGRERHAFFSELRRIQPATHNGSEKEQSLRHLVQDLRIRGQRARRQFQHGGRDALIVDGRQVPGSRFQHRRLGAKQVRDVAQPRFVAILGDAKTLFRLGNRCFRHFDALIGGTQIGVRAADLEPDGGTGTLLLRLALAQREFRFPRFAPCR